jgi:hypothetical protein
MKLKQYDLHFCLLQVTADDLIGYRSVSLIATFGRFTVRGECPLPQLMIRMLIVGYCYGIRHERRSGCTLVIDGSASSISPTRSRITLRFQSIVQR